MTTASWSTTLDQSTDAAFRVWGSELSVKFAAVGMVQTADTGQINWTTVTRAAINTAAGYEIWKLSSSNLYFKIEYGSGAATTTPNIFITVGTGSNGSGTITGQTSTRGGFGASNATITSTVTNYQSYLCATANYMGLSWKIGSSGTTGKPRLFTATMQTVDNTGAATSVGFFFCAQSTVGFLTQCVATTAGVTGSQVNTTSGNFFIIPNNTTAAPANFLDGAGNNQAMVCWFSVMSTTPMTPLLHMAIILTTDLTLGNTASMAQVGSTAHTYISAGSNLVSDAAAVIGIATLSVAMIWE